MKTNKRIALILGAVLLAAGIVTAGFAVRRGSVPPRPSVPPSPEDTTLEYWICDDAAKIDWSGHQEVLGIMGGREFLGSGYHLEDTARVLYTLTAWPDYADGGSYITRIRITDPAVSVYGLTVNADFQAFREVFTSMGFRVEPAEDFPGVIRATLNGFTVTLLTGDTPELIVSAHVTNRQGIQY